MVLTNGVTEGDICW